MSQATDETIAVYVRVSTSDQDPQRQLDDCRAAADRRGAGTVPYVDHDESGASFDREQFQQLRADVAAGDVDTVMATEASRLGRSFVETAEFIQHCYDHGVAVEVLDGSFPTVDPGEDDPMAKKVAELMAWVADLERQYLRQRVESGLRRAQREGKWTGRPPYGFTTDGDGYLVVEPTDYLAIQAALEALETDPEATLPAVARHAGIPKSTLSRVANDPERRRLYLYGEAADDRVATAVDKADVDGTELEDLRDRVAALEARLPADVDTRQTEYD